MYMCVCIVYILCLFRARIHTLSRTCNEICCTSDFCISLFKSWNRPSVYYWGENENDKYI